MAVRVQTEPFDVGAETEAMRTRSAAIGAVVSFVGQVRDMQEAGVSLKSMTLEHYPEMTQKSLLAIEEEARQRWPIADSLIVHRVGELKLLEPIVLVLVASAHRGDAFRACEFIMDYLKTQAPFWKKEATSEGAHWVEARECDNAAALRWKEN